MIEIKNKLQIAQDNTVQVPGCEPTTSLTSTGLLRNLSCNGSRISVEDVLRLIPGSRVVRGASPLGNYGTGSFIELPSGPPPNSGCPSSCGTDWYAILKENASNLTPRQAEATPECAGFDYMGWVRDQEAQRAAIIPDMRPNGDPLGRR